MKLKYVALAGMIALVSACNVDPQKAHDRRQVLMAKVFPNPADRQGLHLAFPIDSGLQVVYFPNQVGQKAVDRRVAGHCQRIGAPTLKISQAPTSGTSTIASGQQVPSVTVWYDCDG